MSRRHWMFFDLGWTLVDETAAHLDRFEKVRVHRPRLSTISDDEFVHLCERHAEKFAPSPFLATLETIDPAGWESLKAIAPYDHAHERLYPGVAELLWELRSSFHLGVIANQSEGTEERLARFGIRDAFSVIAASAESGFCKPDTRLFAHAQTIARCKPADATMVGDRLDNDIGPAKAAGWTTVRVLQGFARHQRPRGHEEVPDLTIASIDKLSCHII